MGASDENTAVGTAVAVRQENRKRQKNRLHAKSYTFNGEHGGTDFIYPAVPHGGRLQMSDFSPSLQRPHEGGVVGVLQVAAHRDAVGQPGDLHLEGF